MYKLDADNKNHDSIITWFKTWENFEAAKNLFKRNVVSFGTLINVVEGLEKFCDNQWKSVWPTINNFKF